MADKTNDIMKRLATKPRGLAFTPQTDTTLRQGIGPLLLGDLDQQDIDDAIILQKLREAGYPIDLATLRAVRNGRRLHLARAIRASGGVLPGEG